MKIIRVLDKTVGLEDINKIYENGHKVAIKFHEDVLLDFTDCILDSEGELCIDDAGDVVLKDCFKIDSGELLAKAYEFVIVDKVLLDKCGVIAVSDVGQGFNTSYLLYKDAEAGVEITADEVFEVDCSSKGGIVEKFCSIRLKDKGGIYMGVAADALDHEISCIICRDTEKSLNKRF